MKNIEEHAPVFIRLLQIMRKLRDKEHGCPWDCEQTLETLKPYLIEEAYEVLEAVDNRDPKHHAEELGDLLLQIVFQAQICEEKNEFHISDVINAICDKLERRHPHIFGSVEVKDSKEVKANWEKLKKKEKGEGSAISPLPKQMPALLKSQRIGEKAAAFGFDWPSIDGVFDKIHEEIDELKKAILEPNDDKKHAAVEHELGDILMALTNLARHLSIDSENALNTACERFLQRFHLMEKNMRKQEKTFESMSITEMEQWWQEAKAEINMLKS